MPTLALPSTPSILLSLQPGGRSKIVPMDELQALYDSEINFSIAAFWDTGFQWKLGDAMNGFVAEGEAPTMKEAIAELVSATRKQFPESHFAQSAPQ
jgi:hypothetical protein